MADSSFSRHFRHQRITYRLVCARRIPHHPAVALYAGPLTFERGQLVEDLLVVDSEMKILGQARSFSDGIAGLFRCQAELDQRDRHRRGLRRRPPVRDEDQDLLA